MAQTGTPSGVLPPKDSASQDLQICPHCGHALYECHCEDRWENEGGATAPPDDDSAAS